MVTGCVLSYQQDSVTVWSGKQVTVYELSGTVLRNTGTTMNRSDNILKMWFFTNCTDSLVLHLSISINVLSPPPPIADFPGSFPCDSHVVAVHGENLYTVEPNRVQIRTPQVCCPTLEPTIQYSLKHRDWIRILNEYIYNRQVIFVTINLVNWWTIFFPLFSLGNSEAAADLLQGGGQPCTTQCVSVLPGGRHRHSTH